MKSELLTSKIIGAGIQVHKVLGPGLLESVYQECLEYELSELGLRVKKEVALPVVYRDIQFEHGFRIDLLVENEIVVEVKSVETLNDVHTSQVITYLRLGGFDVGLLMNFNVSVLRNGLKRIILSNRNLRESPK